MGRLTCLIALLCAGLCAVPASARAPRVSLKLFGLRHTIAGGWTLPTTYDVVHGSDHAMWFDVRGQCGNNSCGALGRIGAGGHMRLFSAPGGITAIAKGPDGKLWELVYGNNNGQLEVGRFNPSGASPLYDLGYAVNPRAMAPGPGGAMYVTDTDHIYRVTQSGAVTMYTLGAPHLAGDLVQGPDGNMWFTSVLGIDSSQYDSIGRLTPDGTVTYFKIPTYNSAPSGITVGPDHNLWFAEGAGRIGRITTAGKIKEFSTHASGSEIAQITSGPGRSLWFTDRGRRAIGRITLSGHVREWAVPATGDNTLWGIAAGPRATVWFADDKPLAIGRLTVH